MTQRLSHSRRRLQRELKEANELMLIWSDLSAQEWDHIGDRGGYNAFRLAESRYRECWDTIYSLRSKLAAPDGCKYTPPLAQIRRAKKLASEAA